MTTPSDTEAGKGASTDKPARGPGLPGTDPASLILNPMMTNPAAAMAAMAQIGIELQTQFATAMFGMMHTAMEASQRLNRTLEEMMPREQAGTTTAAKAYEAETTGTVAKPAKADKPVAVKGLKKAAPKAASSKPADKSVAARPIKAKTADVATAVVDDLKKISGIGPKIETMLNGLGVKTLADIAGWSKAEGERVDAELGVDGRIERDNWIGQAKALLSEGDAVKNLSPAKVAGRRKHRT